MTAPIGSMIPEEEVREALAPHYVLEKELGRGGMGAVYLARDVRLDRPVAIKFLPPEMAAREDLRARFLQETRTAASFSHPNIVPGRRCNGYSGPRRDRARRSKGSGDASS